MLNGADQVTTRTKGVVDNQGNALLVADLCNRLEIRDVVSRVANALDVDGLGLVVNGGTNVLWLVALDKLGLDTEAREHDLELVVGSAIEVRSGDNVVAGMSEGGNGHYEGSEMNHK